VHSGGVPLLQRAMSNLVSCLQRDADMRADEFNGRPYYRIILGFIQEMSPDNSPDSRAMTCLTAIATALHHAQPLQTPGFAFHWLELMSHRCSISTALPLRSVLCSVSWVHRTGGVHALRSQSELETW
jgi:CCR4-NOT transcription complex subunit 1